MPSTSSPEEGTVLVNGVEAFGFATAHPDALGSDDTQAGIFEHLGDGARQVALGCIRLDHREGAFNRHSQILCFLGKSGRSLPAPTPENKR
ncbi:hypothetical protein ACVIRM_002543 [Rhizobium laguerreae]